MDSWFASFLVHHLHKEKNCTHYKGTLFKSSGYCHIFCSFFWLMYTQKKWNTLTCKAERIEIEQLMFLADLSLWCFQRILWYWWSLSGGSLRSRWYKQTPCGHTWWISEMQGTTPLMSFIDSLGLRVNKQLSGKSYERFLFLRQTKLSLDTME